jgi:hypothetical protein
MTRLAWASIVDRAQQIVASYDTPVTLRQLFYRLVAAEVLPNTHGAYKELSAQTVRARKAGTFPDLMDTTRSIRTLPSYSGISEFAREMVWRYGVDRTEGQPVSVYLAIEKRGLLAQLESWFASLGIRFLPLGGYASQTFKDSVRRNVMRQDRPAVLLYGGDHDPSGEDIDRDFIEQTDCWETVQRVALTWDQVVEHNLPPLPGKATDSRAAAFERRHGRLVQVELDALPPDVLRGLFQAAIDAYWDKSAYDEAVRREERDRERLEVVAEMLESGAIEFEDEDDDD